MKQYRTRSKQGIGYVIIPKNEDRGKYINTSLRKGRVSILLEDGGGVAHNCYVAKHVLQDIVFPSEFGKCGSPVMFHISNFYRTPMIFAIFQEENNLNVSFEGEKILESFIDNDIAQVKVSGDGGQIDLIVNSEQSGGGVINLNVKNKDKTGKLNIKVIGDSNIYTYNDSTVTSENNLNLVCKNVTTGDEYSMKLNKETGVTFNDNVLSSFIADINKLTDQINLVEDKVNAIIEIIRDIWVPVTTDGGAALKALFASVLDLQNTTVDDIKDENIKN